MVMKASNRRKLQGVTLLEIIVAMAIIVVIFATLLPQIKAIQNSWASKRANAEVLQNGRALVDHILSRLLQAHRITAVSAAGETNGYIEYEDNQDNPKRYQIGANHYVQFGAPGSPADLAGPVSSLQFTCYDAYDLDTPITEVERIRSVKVQATIVNAAPLGQDRIFSGRAYLRSNTSALDFVIDGSHCEFDFSGSGMTPALAKIDDSHFVCAYTSSGGNGWAVVLIVDATRGKITSGTAFNFDTIQGLTPALAKIDDTHYLCAYTGQGSNGWAVVLTVNPATWTITRQTPFEFDAVRGLDPAMAKIDNSRYLCAYTGPGLAGLAVVLVVSQADWTITKQTPFTFEPAAARTPALAGIDPTHYLCAYDATSGIGTTTVLTVDPLTWTITKGPNTVFGPSGGKWADLAGIDAQNYLCAYTTTGNVGWACLLRVNPATWTVARFGSAYEFGPDQGKEPVLGRIDADNTLCVWDSVGGQGTAAILKVNTTTGNVIKDTIDYYFDRRGIAPALAHVKEALFIGVYQGQGSDGWAVLFNSKPILP